MKRWKSWLLIVALLTIGTLSLGQAQWNPDTTNFYPAVVIKEMFGVFEAIKVGTNLTASEKSGNSTVVRGGKFVDSNIDNPDIDGADIDGSDIDGGTIDGVDLSATSADLNKPDIDGGTIDGATIGSTVDIVEAKIRFDNRTSNPGSPSEGDAYWNSSVDSLRIYGNGRWRNIGQRGSGYYELTIHTVDYMRYNSSDDPPWSDSNSFTNNVSQRLNGEATNPNRTLPMAYAYCRLIHDADGVSAYSLTTINSFESFWWPRDTSFYTVVNRASTTSAFSSNSSRTFISGCTCITNYGTGV